jgi:hypothetical protein
MESSFCLCACLSVSLNVAWQRLGKHVRAEANTYATIEEMLDVVFSMRSALYEIWRLHYITTYQPDNTKYTHCKHWLMKGFSSAANIW